MEDVVSTSQINYLRQKLDSLKAQIDLMKSLGVTISAEFDSLYKDVASTIANFDSSSSTFDVTKSDSDSISSNYDSTPRGNDATLKNYDSSSVSNDASSRLLALKSIIIDSSKSNLKLKFTRPGIPERLAKILVMLIDKKQLTVPQMMSLAGMSRVSITRDIKILRELGWVKFIGSRKNGYFILTTEGEKAIVNIK
jgi:hypothetical protein